MKPEEAIDVLERERNKSHWDSLDELKQASDAWKMAIDALQELKNRNQNLNNSSDPIRRQDAIRIVDGIDTWQAGWRGDAIESMKALPSAQPEIIYCKECKFAHMTYDGDCKYCDVWFSDESYYLDGDYYCASAERRTDEGD